MGTRSLIMVIIDGSTKVAQYSQWDGDPGGQGTGVLEFLRNKPLDLFKAKVRKCRFMSESEMEALGTNWKKTHPQCSRDLGSDVLDYIINGAIDFVDASSFAGDSISCEWAYVVDFDKNTFEVYKGFNKEPISESERFYSTQPKGEKYFQVKHLRTFDLSNLPDSSMFMSNLFPQEVEE